MRQALLIAALALITLSCKKDEKFLMSGTWTVDRVEYVTLGTETNDGVTKVTFNDNGLVTVTGVDQQIPYFVSGNKIYFGEGNSTHPIGFNASKNSLTINWHMQSIDLYYESMREGMFVSHLSK